MEMRYWVQFTSWMGTDKINSFDTEKEAIWFAKQVKGKILPWGGGQYLSKTDYSMG